MVKSTAGERYPAGKSLPKRSSAVPLGCHAQAKIKIADWTSGIPRDIPLRIPSNVNGPLRSSVDRRTRREGRFTHHRVVRRRSKRANATNQIMDMVGHGFEFVDLGLVRSRDGDITCTREVRQSRAQLQRPRPPRLRVDEWNSGSVPYGYATTFPLVYYRSDSQRWCCMKVSMGRSKLQRRYYDPKRVGSYGGVAALRRVVLAQDVERWLSEQDTYTLHKAVIRRFKGRCVVVGGPNQQWQAGLVDMSRLKCPTMELLSS